MTQDPFAATAVDTEEENPFGSPERSAFPRPAELLYKLLVMTPVKFDKTVKPGSKNEMQDRAHVDVVVLHDDGSVDEYEAMYWSQVTIVNAMRKAAKSGRPTLATLHIVPVQKTRDRYPDEEALLRDEDIQRWLGRGGGGLPPLQIAWVLEPATPEQTARALKWWNARPVATPFG
jgi:hypothetical protein